MAKKRLPKNFKVCATCAKWSGSRQVDGTRSLVEFEEHQKGECIKGGFDHGIMHSMNSCSKYQRWL